MRKSLCSLLGICLLFVGVLIVQAQDDTVLLTWNAPTTNTDGSPLTDLAGYRVYMSFAPITTRDPAQKVADISVGQQETTISVEALPQEDALVYFRATAVDTSGNESLLSNEVIVEFLAPDAPTLRIVFP